MAQSLIIELLLGEKNYALGENDVLSCLLDVKLLSMFPSTSALCISIVCLRLSIGFFFSVLCNVAVALSVINYECLLLPVKMTLHFLFV